MPSHGAFLLLHGPLESGQKKRAGIKPARGLRFAECGFSFSPEGWQKLFIALALKIIHIIHISGYADMQKVFVWLYTNDIVADFR